MAVFRVPMNIAWDGPGTPGVNVWHVRTVGLDNSAEVQQAVNALASFYAAVNGSGSGAASLLPTGWTANVGQAVNVEDQSTVQPTMTQISGAGGVGEAPQLLQVCVSWRTSIAARRGMGRTFVGPLKQAVAQADGTIDNTMTTRVRDAATALVSASLVDNGWALGVYGLASPAPAGTTDFASLPHVLRDFTASSVRDRFAVLRSRRD